MLLHHTLAIVTFPLLAALPSSAFPLTKIDSPSELNPNPIDAKVLSIPSGGGSGERSTVIEPHYNLVRRAAEGPHPADKQKAPPDSHEGRQGVLRGIVEDPNANDITRRAALVTHGMSDVAELEAQGNHKEANTARIRMRGNAREGTYGTPERALADKTIHLAKTEGLGHVDLTEMGIRATIEGWEGLGAMGYMGM